MLTSLILGFLVAAGAQETAPPPAEQVPAVSTEAAQASVSTETAQVAAAEPAAQPAPEGGEVSKWGAVGLFAFVLLLIGGLIYFIVRAEKAWFEAARAVAQALGCPHPPYRSKSFTEDFEVHQWDCQGVAVTLSAGSKGMAAPPGAPPGAAVVVMNATVEARLPRPLPFQLAIGKPNTVEGNRLSTGDAEFDSELWASSSQDGLARRLLDDPGLRKRIRDFSQSSKSLPAVRAWITQELVAVKVFDRKLLRQWAQEAVSLANLLSERAAALVPPAPGAAAGAAAPALPAADPQSPCLILAAVETEFPSWKVQGPCLLRAEGVYLFIRSIAYHKEKEGGAGEIIGEAMGEGLGGAVGRAAGAALGAAAERQFEDAPARPAGVYIGARADIAQRIPGAAMTEAPDLLSCRDFIVVPRSEIQKVELYGGGRLAFMTAGLTFKLYGAAPDEKVKGFLAFRGYPVA